MLTDRVTAELRLGRSPVAIWADLVADEVTICAAIYIGGLSIKATECLASDGPVGSVAWPGTQTSARLCPTPRIARRASVTGVSSATGKSTRSPVNETMPEGSSADAIVAGLVDGLDRIPDHLRKSITFDQRTEWGNWTEISDGYDMDVWFCEPHSPVATGSDRELQPPVPLVVPSVCGHRTRLRRPLRIHRQRSASTGPRLHESNQTLRCCHRAVMLELTVSSIRDSGRVGLFIGEEGR